ncbi:glycosyltransferase family 2 protein [Rossellomorea marisflavi]|uniref:glycosyltransferase family 2 protein n=1 Tax=Rossellomorea marisflavi TaxID=189381 RepID=UPI001EE28CDD|nr:glycosyltransferase family 2 protein [Rossellomorea marisflavi]UKS64974.1 glycosyltransferase [Rossellomorea marisflavi]
MNPDKLVSVIVSTYRRDHTLICALNSIARQTYVNLEIIVVDDNADYSWNQRVKEIISEVKQNNIINIKHQINVKNLGSSKSRNVGIGYANGVFITFLDDDDIYMKKKVEKQVLFMMENKLDFCITDLKLYNESNDLVDYRKRLDLKTDIITNKTKLLKYHLLNHLTGTDTLMFKKEYIKLIGCFPEIDIGDEFYLMLNAINGDGKFGYLPECDVKAFEHTKTFGLSSGDGKIAGEIQLFNKKKQFFHMLNSKEKKIIKMRHFAVLAYAELRRKNYLEFIKNSTLSFIHSPSGLLKIYKIRKNR